MCNACGNYCCGSDMFGGCGCDGCEEPECWSDDNGLSDTADPADDYDFAGQPRPSRFRCTETTTPVYGADNG